MRMRRAARNRAGAGRRLEHQRGHLMAGLMVTVAIMLIFSTVAFQEWSSVLRRDNEAEMMFRAQDIVRAIQRYRRDHGGSGPLKLELLMEPGPNGQYYLRRLYEDPLVPDGKWGLLYLGPGGQILDPNAQLDESGLGGLGSGLGGLGSGQTGRLGGLGSGLSGRLGGAQGAGQGEATAGLGGSQAGGSGSMARGSRSGLPNSPLNPEDPTQLEGLPIIGVKTLCKDNPFRVYNGLTSYDQWLFTYFDLEPRQAGPGQGAPGAAQRPGLGQGLGGGRQGAGQWGAGQQGAPQQGAGSQSPGTIPTPPRQPRQPRRPGG